MTYIYETANKTNLLVLDEGKGVLSSAPASFAIVGLGDLSLPKLRQIWSQFKHELRVTLLNAMSMTREEFKNWHVYGTKYDFGDPIIKGGSCVGFKPSALERPKLAWLRQPAVIQALIDLELVPRTTPSGKPRTNLPRGLGSVSDFCFTLNVEQQRQVLKVVFSDPMQSLDAIIRFDQTSLIDTETTDKSLDDAADAFSAMTTLATALWEFDVEQRTAAGPEGKSRGEGRHFAPAWFCAYLAREGHVLLPRLQNSELLLPQLLRPFLWTMWVPKHSGALARHLIEVTSSEGDAHYVMTPFRQLLLCTNFFRESEFQTLLFLQMKREFTTSVESSDPTRPSAVQFSHGTNRLFNAYLRFFGKTWEDVGPDARFFGGGYKAVSDHSREAFAWIDNPKRHRLSRYKELVGEPPDEFPAHIRAWAQDLRSVVALFGVAAPTGKIESLDHWLIYLIKIGPEAPLNWQGIIRKRHINHVGLGTDHTFFAFLQELEHGNKQKVISDLQQAWRLAAERDGFAAKITCPIDIRIDHAGKQERGFGGRTRRKAVPEQIYHVLVDENRKNDFEFARSISVKGDGRRSGQRLHWRDIVNPQTSRASEIFWPALPMILDVILTMGTRSGSALWLDSGEADDEWIDQDTLSTYPNPLSTRSPGKAAGFLRLCQLGPKEAELALGMHLEVNKTGPYSTSWIDPDTARFYTNMRDWQVNHNTRKTPILASRSDLDKAYAGAGMITEVFPVFRDPASRSGFPPTADMLYSYWTALVEHCQPIVTDVLGLDEPLLVDGRPRWDLHSLRVTTVSILIENGVPPWIVAELVGHKSLMMTWHYKEINHRETHLSLQKAHEQRRQIALDKIIEFAESDFSGDETELEAEIKRLFGGLVKLRDDNVSPAMFRRSKADGVGYEVFAHGICPGGDCDTGGEEYKNVNKKVFRPRACSRCRYRLTGPAFLPGLVHRLNSLMVEIKASMDKESGLNTQLDAAEDEGRAASKAAFVVRGLVAREREMRDELWQEWCAELSTIKKAEDLLGDAVSGDRLPVVTGLTPGEIHTKLETVHQLSLLHTVLADGSAILGATLEISDGLRERRDAMLLEVARNNDLTAFFWRLDPARRAAALDGFGDLLLDHVGEVAKLQALIDGQLTFGKLPALQTEVDEFIGNTFGEARGKSAVEVKSISPAPLQLAMEGLDGG